jgi:Fe-S cluster assembly ATPase SufC
VKPAEISGIRKTEYLKDKMNELVINSKKKIIRNLYKGINEFKRATNLEIS